MNDINVNKKQKSISHLTINTSLLHYKEHAVDTDRKNRCLFLE